MVIGLVDERGRRIISAGRLDNGTDQRVNGETVFEIGSVTKTFTPMLTLETAEGGGNTLDNPVANYLPRDATTTTRGRAS